MELSEKLRLLRYAHDYTREYVAYKLCVSFNHYVKLESGEEILTLDQAKLIGELYQINAADLVQDDDEGLNFAWEDMLEVDQYSPNKDSHEASMAYIKAELASIKEMLQILVEKQDI
ncbi:MAG TPA: helix-turn-helix transcriptional regulator [Pseudosphingobacterium sp.]|nr:helix-turn-helix transcriptional regulator [Pseudosphingobacterium sp.]